MAQSVFHSSARKLELLYSSDDFLKYGNEDIFVFSGFTHLLWLVQWGVQQLVLNC